jgi:hypothetical protein
MAEQSAPDAVDQCAERLQGVKLDPIIRKDYDTETWKTIETPVNPSDGSTELAKILTALAEKYEDSWNSLNKFHHQNDEPLVAQLAALIKTIPPSPSVTKRLSYDLAIRKTRIMFTAFIADRSFVSGVSTHSDMVGDYTAAWYAENGKMFGSLAIHKLLEFD